MTRSTTLPPLQRRLPSPMMLYVIGLGAVLFGLTVAKGVQDPDFFWHLTTGELIASSGSVPSTDPFSFTWGGRPWTPHEWLSQLLMHLSVSRLGEAATLTIWALIPVAIFAVMAFALRRHGVGVRAFAAASIPTAFVLAPYLTVRPQAISWLLIAGLIAVLMALRSDRPARSLVLVPYFTLWANLHGLWVVGLGVVAAYALFTIAGRTPMAAARGWLLLGAAGAVAATALTPAGPEGILYPLRYVNAGDWGLANIREWQSPDFHDPIYLGFLVLIVAVTLNAGRATPGWLVLVSSVGIVMGLISARNIPLAALLSLPTLALGVEDRLAGLGWTPPRPTRLAFERRLMEMALAAIVAVSALVVMLPGAPGLVPDPSRFPVAAVDRLIQIDPSARTFAEYGWGGYVISRVYPEGGRVFVDGRNDMYDDWILETYSAIRAAEGDWETELDRWDVDAVLLPQAAPLVRGSLQDAGWCVAHRDELATLLTRECP